MKLAPNKQKIEEELAGPEREALNKAMKAEEENLTSSLYPLRFGVKTRGFEV